MRKTLLIITLFFTINTVYSQWASDYGMSLGVSNYLGDIGGKEGTRRDFISDVKMSKTRWNVGGFARRKINSLLSLKLALEYLRIEGDDKLSTNPARNIRNLNFVNDIFDLGFTGEIFFYENNDLGGTYKYKNGFRAYVFGGVGLFYSNPKANYNGEKIALRPLQTEGVAYSPVGVNIPVGLGFYFTVQKRHRIGFEMNWRTTFTDYLDDISTSYPEDPKQLSAQGKALSLRTPELGLAATKDPGIYYSHNWGEKRGDASHNDSYITMNVSYSYVIKGKSSFYKNKYGGFFGGSSRNKVRRIRAKF